jgi:hypothetical protein
MSNKGETVIEAFQAHAKTVIAVIVSFATAVVGWTVVLVTSATVLPVVGAVLVAALAAGSTYWVAVRHGSGRIATSEAADLWKESQEMRRELRAEAERLRTRIIELEQRETLLENRILELETLRNGLQQRVRELEMRL